MHSVPVYAPAQSGAIGVTILRCFNIAGAVDGVGDTDMSRIIPKALAVAAGKANKLTINGDGSAVREFTHVIDVGTLAAVVLNATRCSEAEVYNVGSGIDTEIIQLVMALTG